MKRVIPWLVVAVAMTGRPVQSEVVITSPTGLPDESDAVLETVVDAVKSVPKDTTEALKGAAEFAGDELRNTLHGIDSAFNGSSEREQVAEKMSAEVDAAWSAEQPVEMRTYTLDELTGKEMVGESGSDARVIDVRDFFTGVPFPEGTSAFYRPQFGRLIVHQTPLNLRAIEELLGRFGSKPDYQQVEIETRFVEIEQKALNELGFDWDFQDGWQISDDWAVDLPAQTLSSALRTAADAFGAGAAGTMTLTKDGWLPLELAISAMEQSGHADVLSAPSITTRDGKKAKIWVGDREKMPTAFSASTKSTSVFLEYEDWEDINIGVHLEVTPKVKENKQIHLELAPEVIDLTGFDSYELTPDNASMYMWAGRASWDSTIAGRYPIPNIPGAVNEAWNKISATLGGGDPNLTADTADYSGGNSGYYENERVAGYDDFGIPVPQVNGSLPVFQVRKIDTSLTVADGGTVGMGGLIYDKLETYKDKVPVLGSIPLLGRLFRSEGERSVKRNLMIFVTATQVDVSGRLATDLAVNP
jgi:general secretion pathway protein D